MRFLTSSLFHDSNRSWPLINRLKYFRIGFWFRRDFEFSKNSIVCIPPRSLTLHHTAESITYQVSVLICSFTNAFSLWCLKIFIQHWYCKSQIVQGIFFTSKVFLKNEVERWSKYENMKNWHFRISLTPRCAWHRRVNFCGVLPTAESISAVWITLRSQNAHHGVKIEIFTSLWVPLKGQSGEILLGVNNSIM